jgi:mannose-6-phosphate isomerase
MEPLRGRVRPYGWGSRTVIAELQGRPAASGPEAELWLGAHPNDPSIVDTPAGPVSLLDRIAADPRGVLGPATVDRFGARLPYLLKVLAAAEPLSLQAHPDAAQAAAGHAAGDPNYADPFHKPELLVALDEFEALCGFRDPDRSAETLRDLGVPALAGVARTLAADRPPGERLREAVTALLSWPPGERVALVSTVAAAAQGPWYEELAARYPDDVGVVVALLLNRVVLRPGEGIWMPAGNLHSYLRGTGVEIMAASDNVLRGGLTPKRVDVAELLRVLRFEVLADPVVRPVVVAPGVETWPVPVPDFALHRATVDGGSDVVVGAPGPRVALCVAGEVTVDDGAVAVTLRRGESAFGNPGESPLLLRGKGVVYIASVGR